MASESSSRMTALSTSALMPARQRGQDLGRRRNLAAGLRMEPVAVWRSSNLLTPTSTYGVVVGYRNDARGPKAASGCIPGRCRQAAPRRGSPEPRLHRPSSISTPTMRRRARWCSSILGGQGCASDDGLAKAADIHYYGPASRHNGAGRERRESCGARNGPPGRSHDRNPAERRMET